MGIGDGFFIDYFKTATMPDKIIIRSDNGEMLVFDGKTKSVIKE